MNSQLSQQHTLLQVLRGGGEPGTWYTEFGRPGGVSGYPRAWYRLVS